MHQSAAVFLSLFLCTSASISEPVILHSLPADRLTKQLEMAYCKVAAVGSICNAAEGKVCDTSHKCVSACTNAGVQPCHCNRCVICCESAKLSCRSSQHFAIYDPTVTSEDWFRQRSSEGCLKTALLPNSTYSLCTPAREGMICDRIATLDSLSEVPKVCSVSKCIPPSCSWLGSNYRSCGCRDRRTAVMCCSDGRICRPLADWLHNDRLVDVYGERIQQFSTLSENYCADFTGFEQSTRCSCSAQSQSCRLCCTSVTGQCIRINATPAAEKLLLDAGSECGLDKVCTAAGDCIDADSYCADPVNSGQRCGVRHICSSVGCGHVCGMENNECTCSSQRHQCQTCCRSANGTCHPADNDVIGLPLSRHAGVTCRQGVCDGDGACRTAVTTNTATLHMIELFYIVQFVICVVK